jgi:hypothetical protein
MMIVMSDACTVFSRSLIGNPGITIYDLRGVMKNSRVTLKLVASFTIIIFLLYRQQKEERKQGEVPSNVVALILDTSFSLSLTNGPKKLESYIILW